jgi:PhnB protein
LTHAHENGELHTVPLEGTKEHGMAVQVYVNFLDETRKAVAFYTKVFGAPEPRIMAFGDLPPDPAHPMDEATKNLVMHTEVEIAGSTVMFSDTPPGMSYIKGNNITLMLQSRDASEIKRWYAALKEGGDVAVELGPESWSKLYGMVHDRYGIGWQFNLMD